MKDFDLTVIGGGAGGLNVASGAVQLGARVALVEKKKLGGDCLYYGCVPTKTLVHVAKIASLIKRSEEFGIDKTPLAFDFKNIMNHMRKVIARIGEHDDPKRFEGMGVKVFFGTGKFIDPHTFELEGKKITSRKFVIATGSRAAVIPMKGLETIPYLTSETALELEYLPKSVIILGGGPIGVEFAQIFTRLGTKVTIIEKVGQILPREDKEIAGILTSILQDEGIEIVTCTNVEQVKQGTGRKGVEVMAECTGHQRVFQADEFMLATGREPNLEGLCLRAAGVRMRKRAIEVDNSLRTTARNIWACGDVTGHYFFTHMAEYHAGIVVANALIPFIKRKVDYRAVPWVTFTDPELGRVGLTEEEARQKYHHIKVFRYEVKDIDRAVAEGEGRGMIKIVCTKKGKILGSHVLAPQAGEYLHEFVMAMQNNLGVGSITRTIHVYPTLAQAVRRTTNQYYAEKIFSGWIPKFTKKLIRWF
ncbi:MAG: dihydrolipoyl dehydrogenase family protein [Candidatus Loosdrechtia sp.]|uniref:dihydrolipoyl dehydrogenase family protein n=1 Tax=Candidatus Loosdrechtia sp. TaxID=3101272 RepID=UPI003A5FDD87|nr:MAG: mercuric reductase [Candidatus Jettenia sp. AMX2]